MTTSQPEEQEAAGIMKLNYILAFFIIVYIAQVALEIWLEKLNAGHTRKFSNRVPHSLEAVLDLDKLASISSYTIAKARERVVEKLISESVLLVLVLCGFLPFLANLLAAWKLRVYPAALLFFLIPGLLLYCVELPFSYYRTFVIEEKFGFNRSTLRIWIADHIKEGLLSLVLFSLLLAPILWLIEISPGFWWLWGFLIVALIQLLLGLLYPVLIAPLFNKFEPVKDEHLAAEIIRLVEANGIKVKKVLQMNAGMRSRHSNAYFTGFGKTKQIVLFDTLLEAHSHDEILSVLAHEIGHFKKKHIIKQLLLFMASMLIVFYLTYLLMGWPSLYPAFGFARQSPYVGLFLAGIFWQKAGYFIQPFYLALSRRFERQADLFAHELRRTSIPLIAALRRLASDNLSNLTPHPLYVWFNYSHPPLAERIAVLKDADRNTGVADRREGLD
jgi:STE24 endopeptidase